MDFYVYLWTCEDNGKHYVGKGRRYRARSHMRKRAQHSVFRRAVEKYGAESFSLRFLAVGLEEQEALRIEVEAIEAYNSLVPAGYNAAAGGRGSSGYKYSPEECKARSLRLLGNKHGVGGPGPIGVVRSAEFRERIRQTRLGTKATEEARANMRAAADRRRKHITAADARTLAFLVAAGATTREMAKWLKVSRNKIRAALRGIGAIV